MKKIEMSKQKGLWVGLRDLTDTHIVAGNQDIFINPDLTIAMDLFDRGSDNNPMLMEHLPVKGHHFHLFINNANISMLNGSLKRYMGMIHKETGEKVYIHLPKSIKSSETFFRYVFQGFDACEMIFHRDKYYFPFFLDDGQSCKSFYRGRRSYLVLNWNDYGRVNAMVLQTYEEDISK